MLSTHITETAQYSMSAFLLLDYILLMVKCR